MGAYRNPSFLIYHAGARPEAAFSAAYPTEPDAGVERLTDRRFGTTLEFSTSELDHQIDLDRGAAVPRVGIDYMLIGAGHNLGEGGAIIRVIADDDPAFGSFTEILPASMVPAYPDGSKPVEAYPLTEDAQRYVRFEWPLLTAGAWQIPELWYGVLQQTATGVASNWEMPLESPVELEEFPTREAALVLGPARRRWRFTHEGLSADDLTIYDDLANLGRGTPFYFLGVDDDEPWRLMRLASEVERQQDRRAPQIGISYTVRCEMIEQTS